MARRQRLAPVPDRPQRVVLYVRVSAVMGRDPEAFHSPAIQLAAMRRATAGMSEVDVVDDIDVTGTTFSREGLDEIRVMVEAGQIDAIAVYGWSRFGRNVREALNFLQWLDDRHVQVTAAGEQADRSTPEGEFSVGMLLQVAQLHSRMIGRAWSRTIADRAQRGRHHGRPVGYRRVKGQPLQPDPAVGPVVTWAFEAYATGLPVIDIAREVGRRRGRQIYTANLKKLFRNPVYLGHVTAGAEIVAYAAHDPLVDQTTWDATRCPTRRTTGRWRSCGRPRSSWYGSWASWSSRW